MTIPENAVITGREAEGFAVQGYSGGMLRKSLFSAVVVSALHFTLLSTTAFAQVAPPPASVSPQQIAPTREEIERTRPQEQAPRSARLVVEGDIERAPCALDAPAYANIAF